ncbi:sigma-54-dependent Fis family transcriptional regulator [Marinobacteraceae bacterium S3BR75-40.1]
MSSADPQPDHADIISASWERCRGYGLAPAGKPVLDRLNAADRRSRQGEYQFLVQTTGNEVLPYYEQILANTDCLILLTDRHGHLLNSWGDQRFITPERKAFFHQGVGWSEPLHGTNAIGTALATGQAVQVQRDEHFLKANRFMVGSAAPIYNAERDLLGVLDISSDAYVPQAHILGMVKLMSQSVENRLIVSRFHEAHFLLTFNTNLDNLDSQWSGLIVFDEAGTIISANRRAELILGYDLALANVVRIFDYPLRELKSHPEGLPLAMRALGKYQMHGLVKRPSKPKVEAVDFREQRAEAPSPSGIGLDRLAFGDARVERCVRQAECIVEKDIPILIHGETGVGKEVFVKALHAHSSRRAAPLVAVNCAAIPGELVESELFGYEKGAFTGASSKGAMGLIRKAHQGTLFLDEIGDMPLKAQARLLRVLQERKVTPLGSTESYPVDIKLISATNRSLRAASEQGLFRQDLYYRVTGLNLELPPLRERTDKRALFQEVHLLHRSPDQPATLSDDMLTLFEQHPWPGNLRQLASVLQIALAMADRDPIETWHLPDDFFADIDRVQAPESDPGPPLDTAANDAQSILDAYNQHAGNVSKTARSLGVSRNTLYKRLRELGIRRG